MSCKVYWGSGRCKTCCYLSLEKLYSSLLHACSRLLWWLREDSGKKGSRMLLFILSMGFLFHHFRKNTTKASEERPEWISERWKQEGRREKNTMHFIVGQYISLHCWFVSISCWRGGRSPTYSVEGAATSVCSTAKPDSRGHTVCAVLLNNPPLPDRSDFVGS